MHPTVQVWPIKQVKGWLGSPSELDRLERHPQGPLHEALGVQCATDAHFVPYYVCNGTGPLPHAVRVRKAALTQLPAQGVEVRFGCLVLDVDAPKDSAEPEVESLYRTGLAALIGARAGHLYTYRTRGGYRVIWGLDREVGPEEYERVNEAVRGRIMELTGGAVQPDPACKDWTRCYRLPFVVRDGVPQRYPVEAGPAPVALPVDALLAAPLDALASAKPAAPRPAFELPTKVADGERNVTLARYAGQLAGKGLGEAEILALLRTANEERCVPPKPDEEVRTIARSISGTEQAKQQQSAGHAPGGFHRGDHAELAERLAESLGPPEGVTYGLGLVHRYAPTKGLWEPVQDGALRTRVLGWAGSPVGSKHVPLKLRHADAEGALKGVRDRFDQGGEGDFFDAAAPGVAFSNGFVAAGPGGLEWRPHSPDHRARVGYAFPLDAHARAPRFERFLAEVFAGTTDGAQRAAFLREFAGACLLGLATRYERCAMLVGSGANGKSTLVSVLVAMFPAGTVVAIPPQAFGDPNYGAKLAGARLNAFAEVPDNDIIAGDSFKAIASGDLITRREAYARAITFRPRAGQLFAANLLPGATDTSNAFWRRWIVVGFERAFGSHEQEKGLADRIITEELPGVIAWALGGAQALLERGPRGTYAEPPSSAELRSDWRRKANPVALFVEERCEQKLDDNGEPTWTPAIKVYSAYQAWASANGHFRLSSTKFGNRLEAVLTDVLKNGLDPRPKRKRSGYYYQLALKGDLVLGGGPC